MSVYWDVKVMRGQLPLQPPEISGFEYKRLLGSGGSSDVFLYLRTSDLSEVAIKSLRTVDDEKTGQKRRQFEDHVLRPLSAHPNILTLFGSGNARSGHAYQVLEYSAAKSFQELYKNRQLPVAEILDFGIQLCSALEACHQAGTAHLDIKPSNILLNNLGRPVLTDFSFFALAGTNSSLGSALTIPWAPPERLQGSEFRGVLADVWHLGATLYTWFSGHLPFAARSAPLSSKDLVTRILHMPLQEVHRSDAPRSLNGVLAKAMAKQPEQRYPSIRDLAAALQDSLSEVGISGTTPPISPFARNHDAPLQKYEPFQDTTSQVLSPAAPQDKRPPPDDGERNWKPRDGEATAPGGKKTDFGTLEVPEPVLAQKLFDFALARVDDADHQARAKAPWAFEEAARLARKVNNEHLWALCTYWNAAVHFNGPGRAENNDDGDWDENDLWDETIILDKLPDTTDINAFRAALMASHDPEDLSEWQITVRVHRDDGNASHDYQRVYQVQRDYLVVEELTTAAEYFTSIGHSIDSARTKQVLAEVLQKFGKYADAEYQLLRAIDLLPNLGTLEAVSCRKKLADFYRDLRWWSMAAKSYKSLLKESKSAATTYHENADFHARLGYVLNQSGQRSESEASYRIAIKICQEGGDLAGEARARIAVSSVSLARGDLRASEYELLEAQRLNALSPVSTAFRLGLLYQRAGRWVEAEYHLREALAASPFVPQGIKAIIRISLAVLLIETGRMSESETLLALATPAMAGRKVVHRRAEAWQTVGMLYEKFGRMKEALRAYEEAKQTAHHIEHTDAKAFATATAFIGISRIFFARSELSLVQRYLDLALAEVQPFGRQGQAIQLQLEVGAAYTKCENWQGAENILRDALQKSESQGLGTETAHARLMLGLHHRDRNDVGQAIRYLTDAAADFEYMHMPRGESAARFELSRAYFYNGDSADSASEFEKSMGLFCSNNNYQDAAWSSVSRSRDLLDTKFTAGAGCPLIVAEEALDLVVPAAQYLESVKHQFPKASDRHLWAARANIASDAAFQLAALTGNAHLISELIESRINTSQHKAPVASARSPILKQVADTATTYDGQAGERKPYDVGLPALVAARSIRLLQSSDLPSSPSPLLLMPTLDPEGSHRIALSRWQEDGTFPRTHTADVPVRTW